jgi:hypothetical protein
MKRKLPWVKREYDAQNRIMAQVGSDAQFGGFTSREPPVF